MNIFYLTIIFLLFAVGAFQKSNAGAVIAATPANSSFVGKLSVETSPNAQVLEAKGQRLLPPSAPLVSKAQSSQLHSPAVMNPPFSPIQTSKILSFNDQLINIEKLRKIANKQLGFISGRLFRKAKNLRNLTGSDCQNSYMEARDAFAKLIKDYGFTTTKDGEIRLTLQQCTAYKNIINKCLESCNPENSLKAEKYANYYNFCKATESANQYMILSKTLENQTIPAVKTISTGTPSIHSIYNSSPEGKQCVSFYQQTANMPNANAKNPSTINSLKIATIGCLNACDPKKFKGATEHMNRSNLRDASLKLIRVLEGDISYSQDKQVKAIENDPRFKNKTIPEIKDIIEKLKNQSQDILPLFSQIQTMNRACWFLFQEKILPVVWLSGSSSPIAAIASTMLQVDGKKFAPQNDGGFFYYAETEIR